MIVEIALSVALLNGAVTMARAFRSLRGEVPALPSGQVLTAHMGRIPLRDARQGGRGRGSTAGCGVRRRRASPPEAVRATGAVAVEAVETSPRCREPAPSHAGRPRASSKRLAPGPRRAGCSCAADFISRRRARRGRQRAVRAEVPGRPQSARTPHPRREEWLDVELDEPWREIVGVVPDLGISVGDPALTARLLYRRFATRRLYYLAIRTTGDPLTLVAPLRKAVAGSRIPTCNSKRSCRSRMPAGTSARSCRRCLRVDGDGRHGAAAVDCRHLRTAVVHGHAPHARNRHPRGAWRDDAGRC